ncbi:hypothetical protein [Nocardioides sp. WS12]|uniref:hypothetical protein n=1 Tax=Nocardioides sp. WS12 TaxID=2486272 RepID=UPI0015FD12C1|nr:hypothetical protein [Nocardioides sp. WS12]
MGESNGRARGIRILQDGSGLIDEDGVRWDRIRTSGYYLTPEEVSELTASRRRFLSTGAYGTPVVEVTPTDFGIQVATTHEHRVTAYRSSAGDGAATLLIDTSDC